MNKFTSAYIECALWSSTDDNGEPCDSNESFDLANFAPVTLQEIESDCADFYTANAELLAESGLSDEQAGHDFWLTRNGHGSGFWDRGLGAIGDKLSDVAKVYGSCDIYLGDDGKVYIQ